MFYKVHFLRIVVNLSHGTLFSKGLRQVTYIESIIMPVKKMLTSLTKNGKNVIEFILFTKLQCEYKNIEEFDSTSQYYWKCLIAANISKQMLWDSAMLAHKIYLLTLFYVNLVSMCCY